ncbi:MULTISPECIES: phage virion morphogenesis protein [unclassified Photorhabdus]|uniref:phage virion morphogenesis protein n=1 Tax=unclassified Photorhabdus TaxID=2620880 RepID=UPI000DCDAE12|nr:MULTISPECIES: phage virion morphogenesis protein [unclassified Photorhabdus]RAX00770.1 phage virion morphogenesis protein [Photorhabdus sp. S9-53]RAX00973.1 phage virion morphogenesis protein [Photorhabdus sp. S10-54]RAX05312.1 phage virion morphogenesis protein [Photorhabdus sp. S8-52]
MTENNSLFVALDNELQKLISTTKPAYRRRLANKLSKAIRADQQKRIRSQKNVDGTAYEPRRRRVLRSQKGIKFLYQGDVRTLKNWRVTRGRRGRMITGFDGERNAVRSFYRSNIERYLEINHSEVKKTSNRRDPMFRRLRTARFLKSSASSAAAVVGFQGRAAAIARQHQYGLEGSINALAETKYPQRQLLGITPHERLQLIELIYHDLVSEL